MTTSKSPSSLSELAATPAAAVAAVFEVEASFARLAAANAGGGMGLPLKSSCLNAQAGFVQLRYLHNSREGPAVSPIASN